MKRVEEETVRETERNIGREAREQQRKRIKLSEKIKGCWGERGSAGEHKWRMKRRRRRRRRSR